MIKKIIIYHFLLFLIVALYSCAKPEQDGRLIVHVLKHAITQGLDFWPGRKDFIIIYIEQGKQLESILMEKIL